MSQVSSHAGDPATARIGGAAKPNAVHSIVLLTGGVRATSLAAQVGRSVLDLPLASGCRLLDVWRERIDGLRGDGRSEAALPDVLILAGSATALPTVAADGEGLRFRAERDASRYRGTAGALRDLCEPFGKEDRILVGTASQGPGEGQIEHLLREASSGDDICLSTDRTGVPTGLFLIRCGILGLVPAAGFIDLKEQGLPRIAREARVRVLECPGVASRALRDRRSYLDALRSWHRSRSLSGVTAVDPYEERWKPAFSIVEPGAEVAPDAQLHDAVVLAGGSVEAGAEVVRCVVGPGGRVRRRERVVDRLVLGAAGGSR